MKPLKDDDLAVVHGGAESTATSSTTLPEPAPSAPMAWVDGSPLPPTLPQKHVEA